MMKKIFCLLAAFLCVSSLSATTYFDDYDFSQDRMLLAEDGIYVISTFDDCDKITAYSYFGNFLWETEFFAKIVSWEVVGTRVIVFSKHRNGSKTYLTCLDRYDGKKMWQRP